MQLSSRGWGRGRGRVGWWWFPVREAQRLLFDRKHFWYLASLIIIADAALSALIIARVNFTEIDFQTYLQQVDLVFNGQRDYARLFGDTGPLVYPAGHVRLHLVLKRILAATSLATIQSIYAALYLASQYLAALIYYRSRGIPNYVLFLLPLSKRLHSIYILRLFNDCWASTAALAAVYSYSIGNELTGTILFSLALSIKMNILLYLPGIIFVLIKQLGLVQTLLHLFNMLLIHVIIAYPFLFSHPRSYLAGAFNLSRQFLYKWTVNWRFLPQHIFLSKEFASGLLLCHLALLAAFALRKWSTSDGGPIKVLLRAILRPFVPAAFVLPSGDEIITILFTCNLIGILCARSLHYQFYSWYAQQAPFLAWRTRYPLPIKIALLVAIEYAWNTYPSTNRSSFVLLASHLLLLIGVFFGYPTGIPRRRVAFKKELVETEPDRVTATEDDNGNGTDSAEEYGDATEGMYSPTRLEFRVPEERVKNALTRVNNSGDALPLNLAAKIADSNELNMMVLDDSSL